MYMKKSIKIISTILTIIMIFQLIGGASLADSQISQLPKWLDDSVRLSLNKPTEELTQTDFDCVTKLDLSSIQSIENMDLGYLSQFNNLKSLSISGTGIKDLSSISKLTSLEELILSQNKITDISFVSNMINLKTFSIYENNITDISSLANLKKLEFVNLSYNKISDISPLANITSLTTLYISNNKITDISAISNLTNLNSLDLEVNPVKNFDTLKGIISLEHLGLNGTNLQDLSPLSSLTGLIELYITNNKIKDLTPISNLTKLQTLNLSQNQIENLTPLSGLINLKELYIAGNLVKDITPLSGLNKLEVLLLLKIDQDGSLVYLGNPIEDYSPIAGIISKIETDAPTFKKAVYLFKPTNNTKVTQYIPFEIKAQASGAKFDYLTLYMTDSSGKITTFGTTSGNDLSMKYTLSKPGIYTLMVEGSDKPETDPNRDRWISENIKVEVVQAPIPSPTATFASSGYVSAGSISVASATPTPTQTATSTPTSASTTPTPTPTIATDTQGPKPTAIIDNGIKIPGTGNSFKDINNHWAKESITNLVDKKIVSGYIDGTFKPNNLITRQELATIIMKALDIKPAVGDTVFKDNDKLPTWAKGYVKAAYDNGIITGYNDGTFMGSNQCSRQEVAVMINKAFKHGTTKEQLRFKDSNNIGNWAKDYVAKALQLKIIKGYNDNTFLPNKMINRAEAVTMIFNSINLKGEKK